MRKVIFGVANSLDNFIARRDGGYDWIMWSDEDIPLFLPMEQQINLKLRESKTFKNGCLMVTYDVLHRS